MIVEGDLVVGDFFGYCLSVDMQYLCNLVCNVCKDVDKQKNIGQL